ncbi:hypothetical protein EYE40_09375 [Glaciihabitans arcticus]|uniref:Uncharacterized protein n=1 Tax=Glaciihabitans arcticus TaxID=2668039 RepID=A0A4Q9GSE4_9MICO|nr:hypothetical protein [Glaciihabitans arcticus]TBN57581.1 hypothetical protein EYE40_09375 [Glaciihabitans arcticus]
MTFSKSTVAMLTYAINSLAALDPDASVIDVLRLAEAERLVETILERADKHGLDVSSLQKWFKENAKDVAALDNYYARSTNANDSGKYWLPNGANGWLWISSLTIEGFFITPDSELPVA